MVWLTTAGVAGCSDIQKTSPNTSSAASEIGGTALPASQAVTKTARVDNKAQYVGSAVCKGCHTRVYETWQGSHHHLAMQPASEQSVLGNFDDAEFSLAQHASRFARRDRTFVITTDNHTGELADFSVRYTFGVAPLQQYLLATEKGRLQAFTVAWDSTNESDGGQRWFHLYADPNSDVPMDHTDVLHWTRPSANWNQMCADCHSTALRKNYDPVSGAYDTTYAEVSVGCEACHGPGSQHVISPGGVSLGLARLDDQDQQLNTCGTCHSRRTQVAEGFTADQSLYDFYLPALMDQGLYHVDGQILEEVYVYGSFLQSKMFQRGVTCSDCHDPHSGKVVKTDNGLCTQCHNAVGRSDYPTLIAADYNSASHHHHRQGSDGARCISCHMPEKTYMKIDGRRDHSFRIPRPDLTVSLGVPNACNNCHDGESAAWAAAVVSAWFGAVRAEHFGEIFAAAGKRLPEAERKLAELAADSGQPPMVRARAFDLLGGYNLQLSGKVIQAGLADQHPLVRIGALRASQRWPTAVQWQRVAGLLADERLVVRMEAARVLMPIYPQLNPQDQVILKRALRAYLAVLGYNQDTAEGLSQMAGVYQLLGEPSQAESALKQALVINPQWVPGMTNLADLYRQTGRDHLAGPLLDEALLVAPQLTEVMLAKALWLVRQGQRNEALEWLARTRRQHPHNAQVVYVYVVALNSAGKTQQALDVADQFLDRHQNERLLQTAYAIARDAGLTTKMQGYGQTLQGQR